MVPVEALPDGCVMLTVGVDGVAGCAFTVAELTDDTHPFPFFTVTL